MTKETENKLNEKPKHPGGRKSKSNDELWVRRDKVARLYAAKLPITEIAHQMGVIVDTVYADLEAFAKMKKPIKERIEIENTYNEILRQMVVAVGRPGISLREKAILAKVAQETNTRLAKLYGLEKEVVNFQNIQENIFSNQENAYDKLTTKELETEFRRRRQLIAERRRTSGRKKS